MERKVEILFTLLGFIAGLTISTPVITPEGEHTVKARDDFTITCNNSNPIFWEFPEVDDETYIIETEHTDDFYVSKLHIESPSSVVVGFYYCKEIKNPDNYASLYLYVDDDRALYAGSFYEDNFVFAFGKQYSPLVIPCTPSNPRVRVKLYASEDISLAKLVKIDTIQEDGSLWSFNNTHGFTLSYAAQFGGEKYTCAFMKGRKAQRVDVSAYVERVFPLIHMPAVYKVKSDPHGSKPENLYLRCDVKRLLDQSISFSWQINGKDIHHSDRYPHFFYTDYSILTVNSFEEQIDNGTYTCTVTDRLNTKEYSLNVFDNKIIVPTISPNQSEHTIQSGENFEIICKSPNQILWTFLQGENLTQLSEVKTVGDDGMYTSKLQMTNASTALCGYYHCQEMSNSNNYVSIYVYVEDDEDLIANWEKNIYGKEGKPFTIPCKPANPDVSVLLYYGSEENVELLEQDQSQWIFNNTQGFTISNATQSHSGNYTCIFRKGTTILHRNTMVEIPKVYSSIQRPVIRKLQVSPSNATTCKQLKCEIQANPGQSIQYSWKFNGKFEQLNHRHGLTSDPTLTICNFDTNLDKGVYTCVVTNGDNVNENSLYIDSL